MKKIINFVVTIALMTTINNCSSYKNVPSELSFSEKENQNFYQQQYFNNTSVTGISNLSISKETDKAYIDKLTKAKNSLQNTVIFKDKRGEKSNNNIEINSLVDAYSLYINTDADILFAFDSYKLSDTAKLFLNDLSYIVKKNFDKATITIIGHTDNKGSHDYNMTLSLYRAISVANYMKIKGITNNIETFGKGKTEPIDNNETESGRKRNRRVEIYLKIKKS